MKINEYADVINAALVIRRPDNQNERWYAMFDDCETSDGTFLSSEYGDGKSPIEAINAYVSIIKGKTLVFSAMRKERRREFFVPLTLEGL